MSRFIILFSFFLVVAPTIQAQDSEILFSINGDSVDFREFEYVYSKNNSLREEAFTRSDIEEYLELYVNFKLKVMEAQSLGIDTTSKFLNEYNTYKDQLARPYLAQENFKDSIINQAYERYKEIINVNHVLILMDKNEEDTSKYFNKIFEIHKKALRESSFEELAKEYSEEPNASSTGGNLGYFTSMQMVYPFENVAYSTEVGSISQPFRTDFGYHILKVNDRKENPGKAGVSHIMLRFRRDMTTGDSLKLEDKINTVYEQLSRSSQNWDSICFVYSEDLRSRENGGKLNPFGVGEIIPVFAEESFAIQNIGEISQPFMSPYGWHIVRLDSLYPIEEKNDILPEIKSKVLRGDRLSAGRKSSTDYLKTKYSYSQNQAGYKELSNYVQEKLYRINTLPESIEKTTLFTLDSIDYTSLKLKTFVANKYSTTRLNDTSIVIDLTGEYEKFVYSQLELLEKKDLELNNPEFRSILKEYKEGMLLFEIMEEKVWNVASTDSIGLKDYYSAHLDQYTAFDSANLIIFEVDLDKLDSIALQSDVLKSKKRRKGADVSWEDLSEWQSTSYDGIYTQRTEDDSFIGIAIDFKNESVIPLSKIKGKVISDYQQEIESKWMQSLYEKYEIVRSEEAIENAIETLSNE